MKSIVGRVLKIGIIPSLIAWALINQACTDGLLQSSTNSGSSGGPSRALVVSGYADSVGSVPAATPEFYDTIAAKWTQTALVGQPYWPGLATLGNGKMIYAGGSPTNGGGADWAVNLWDPSTGSWTSTTHMNFDRNQFNLVQMANGNVMAIGGCTAGCTSTSMHGFTYSQIYQQPEIYDQTLQTWTNTSIMTTGRASTPAAVLLSNGNILVCGGGNGISTTYATCEIYNGSTWAATGSLLYPTQTLDHTKMLTLQNGNVILVSNDTSIPSNYGAIEIFNGSTWSLGSMPATRRFGPMVLLKDGRVALLGGQTYASGPIWGLVNNIDIYDPNLNSWSSGGFLQKAREGHMATLLKDGRVLVTGGCSAVTPSTNSCTTVESSVEIYDPTTQSSTMTNSLFTARWGLNQITAP